MPGGKMLRASMLIPASMSIVGAALPQPQTGGVYEIVVQRETRSRSSDGSSSSSSNDRDAVIERIMAVNADGVELEYDLPREASADQRAVAWQFPFRVFKPTKGAFALLNAADLASRVDAWLKRGNMTRAACGTWIFTWNAFLIECDPKSALSIATNFSIQPADLRADASYDDPLAAEPGRLSQRRADTVGSVFDVKLAIDPDKVRRGEAESDVIVSKISGKPISLDTALKARAGEKISGSITVTFEADGAGVVRRRTRKSEVTIVTSADRSETRLTQEVTTRRLLPALDARSSHVAPSV